MFEQKFFFLHAFIFYPLPKRLHFQSISYTILLMELKGNLKEYFKNNDKSFFVFQGAEMRQIISHIKDNINA